MSSQEEKHLLDLIGRLYDAALDDALWPMISAEIPRVFNSTSTALHTRHFISGRAEILAATPNLEPFMPEYQAYYGQRDVWVDRAAALGLNRIIASKDMISDSEFEETEYYRDWCRKVGDLFYVVGAVVSIARDEVGVLGIHRPRAAGTFDDSDKRRVGQILPHFRRALQVRRRLVMPNAELDIARDVLQRSKMATLVVGRGGKIVFANSHAEALLRQSDAITAIHGRLTSVEPSVKGRLDALIENTIRIAERRAIEKNAAMTVERAARLPLTILAVPFGHGNHRLPEAPAALVFVRDPELPSPSVLALQGLFGLTRAEAAVASALADGKSIEEIARANNVALNTIRTQLKNIFAKTGTNRQGQLIALILRSVSTISD